MWGGALLGRGRWPQGPAAPLRGGLLVTVGSREEPGLQPLCSPCTPAARVPWAAGVALSSEEHILDQAGEQEIRGAGKTPASEVRVQLARRPFIAVGCCSHCPAQPFWPALISKPGRLLAGVLRSVLPRTWSHLSWGQSFLPDFSTKHAPGSRAAST